MEPALLVVLDIDGTLIANPVRMQMPAESPSFVLQSSRPGRPIWIRPGALELLTWATATNGVRLGVFTAADQDYAKEVMLGLLSRLSPPCDLTCLACFLSSDDCQRRWHGSCLTTKNLAVACERAGAPLNRTLIVDDSATETCSENRANAIHVRPWRGQVHGQYYPKERAEEFTHVLELLKCAALNAPDVSLLGLDQLGENIVSWRSLIQWDFADSKGLENSMQEVNVTCAAEHQASFKPKEGCQRQESLLENLEIHKQEMSKEKVSERYLVDLT
eukprot:gnl/MRDRNA2_/MRDRNA2_120192_c0_seq1.p1 gnl/MRDRNA2_/MRDRNA2_120192_c0~~gnl/MRDRNA2_/MRDRNA2_120192_c0_seq1.p1  ORF type:complete len:289 (-),score=57.63 gnl/MRDRNA2_/MRDRNA2_120192_c0_seq1:358-1182(-)